MSRRILGWTLLGLAAFAAVLLARAPAGWLGSFLPGGVSCGSFGGTVWRGSCSQLAMQTAPGRAVNLDRLEWDLELSALLRGRLAAEVRLLQAGGEARGHVSIGSGQIDVDALAGQIPVDNQLLPMLPLGWRGGLAADGLAFTHDAGALTRMQGGASLLGVQDGAGNPLGSYELRFDDTAAPPPFSGRLRDLGGPLAVQSAVRLEATGAWQIDGRVAPRPEASPGLARQLSALGLPAADGSYPFSIAGEAD